MIVSHSTPDTEKPQTSDSPTGIYCLWRPTQPLVSHTVSPVDVSDAIGHLRCPWQLSVGKSTSFWDVAWETYLVHAGVDKSASKLLVWPAGISPLHGQHQYRAPNGQHLHMDSTSLSRASGERCDLDQEWDIWDSQGVHRHCLSNKLPVNSKLRQFDWVVILYGNNQ